MSPPIRHRCTPPIRKPRTSGASVFVSLPRQERGHKLRRWGRTEADRLPP